ncbi:hypothetical protein [Micromonospora sp. NPDC049679]|uniref:hypothetical protein n=1 Tax=Micromonospora sp. NPDC049679 TaxID=3155920 RepID=UPI0033C463F0
MLLEGPEIEPLLAQVRDEYGASARIVNAEKVRSGGVGGFFAREHFELSVEVPDGAVTGPAATNQAGMSRPTTSSAPWPANPSGAGGMAPSPPGGSGGPAAQNAPRSLDDLLNLAEAQEERLPARPLATPAEPTPTNAPPTPAATATPEAVAPEPVTPGRVTPGPVTPGASAAPTASPFVASTFATASIPSPAATPATGMPLKRPIRSASAVPRAALVSTTGPAFAEIMAELNAPAVTEPSTTVATRPHHAATVATVATTAAPAPVVARLVDLGLPEPLATRVIGNDPYQEVLDALAALPAPPREPRKAGDVLVITGELAHALPIAREVAQRMHLDPAKILLAAPTTGGTGLHASRRISGPAEAHRRARMLHRAEVPHVVVIDTPITTADDGWGRSICDALGATAVWAAVDATRKLADTARHLRLMGPVNATAVYATSVCSDPAAVLALDPPVALLESRPATPAAWAQLLTERLRGIAGDAEYGTDVRSLCR